MDTIKNKDKIVHIRISRALLMMFKKMAKKRKLKTSTYIRLLMKRELIHKKYATRYIVDNL